MGFCLFSSVFLFPYGAEIKRCFSCLFPLMCPLLLYQGFCSYAPFRVGHFSGTYIILTFLYAFFLHVVTVLSSVLYFGSHQPICSEWLLVFVDGSRVPGYLFRRSCVMIPFHQTLTNNISYPMPPARTPLSSMLDQRAVLKGLSPFFFIYFRIFNFWRENPKLLIGWNTHG